MPWQRDGFKLAFFQFRAKFEHVAGELWLSVSNIENIKQILATQPTQ